MARAGRRILGNSTILPIMTDMGFSPDNVAEGIPQLPTDLSEVEDAETSYKTPDSANRAWWSRNWWIPLLAVLALLALLIWGIYSCSAVAHDGETTTASAPIAATAPTAV